MSCIVIVSVVCAGLLPVEHQCVCVCVCVCVWQENPLGRESVQCVDVCGESQCVANVGIQDLSLIHI